MSEAERLPNTINLAFVEGLYLDYLKDPLSVPAEWRAYFDQLSNSDRDSASASSWPNVPSARHLQSIYSERQRRPWRP